jgi:hypothetical protein
MTSVVDKTVCVFDSQAAADRADREYYASLTPNQRLVILLDLIATHREALGETAERFERVHRVAELSQG